MPADKGRGLLGQIGLVQLLAHGRGELIDLGTAGPQLGYIAVVEVQRADVQALGGYDLAILQPDDLGTAAADVKDSAACQRTGEHGADASHSGLPVRPRAPPLPGRYSPGWRRGLPRYCGYCAGKR